MSNWFRSPTSDVFFGNFANSSLGSGQTRFVGAGGVGFSTTEEEVEFIMTRAGIIKFLTEKAEENTRVNATTVTLRKNGVDTLLALTIPASPGGTVLVQNTTDVVNVVAGDRIAVKFVAPVGGGSL